MNQFIKSKCVELKLQVSIEHEERVSKCIKAIFEKSQVFKKLREYCSFTTEAGGQPWRQTCFKIIVPNDTDSIFVMGKHLGRLLELHRLNDRPVFTDNIN